MEEWVHISSVQDGSIITFNDDLFYWMKVCDKNGIGGVVRLYGGLYIPVSELKKTSVKIVAKNLDELYYDEEDS